MSLSISASSLPQRAFRSAPTLVSLLALAALQACGGGGGGGSSTPTGPASTVTDASVAVTRYGAAALVTVTGTALDSAGFAVTSSTCKNMTRLTTGNTISTATTAYYNCTVSGAYTGSVAIASNGTTLATRTYTVLQPIVSLAVTNGAGVAGNIVIALNPLSSPITVDNFLAYVNSGFYDGTIFHRVVPGFVIQGGGATSATSPNAVTFKTPTFPSFQPESSGGTDTQWTIAMAQTGSGAQTSQFFFNVVDNSSNLPGFPTFGALADSASVTVAQSILAAPLNCLTGSSECVPVPNVVVTKATQTQ